MSSMHDLFDGSEAQSLMLWRRYTGEASGLPAPFVSVLLYKEGEDGAFIGVFSGYRADDEAAWISHNAVIGALPIEPGDWWMPYPDPPGGEN